MVVLLKKNADEKQLENLVAWLASLGIDVHKSEGEYETVLGLIGDTSKVDIDFIQSLGIVENVTRISEPYKNANRKFHPEDSVVEVAGHKIGGGHFQIIAGPCSVESEEQIISIAREVADRKSVV